MLTCSKVDHMLERLIAGDADRALHRRLERHAKRCQACRMLWQRALAIRSALQTELDDTTGRIGDELVSGARDRLRSAFSRANQPPVRFSSMQTPFGLVFVGLSDRGVCDVTLGVRREAEYRARLARRAPEIRRDDAGVQPVIAELEAYFAGERRSFSVQSDLRAVPPFMARVLRAARNVRFGRVTSYGALAAKLGMPGASRAVGGALSRNPVPVIIPCHRVVQGTGDLGGYIGGRRMKRLLLQLEGHRRVERNALAASLAQRVTTSAEATVVRRSFTRRRNG